MSKPHITHCPIDDADVARLGGLYRTTDFYLACFMCCNDYELVDVEPQGRRSVFVFRDKPGRRDELLRFYNNEGAIRPLAFVDAIKNLKALVHNI